MNRRTRPLLAILALTAAMHVLGIVRNPLPAQDGLKFIRIAREFGHRPWSDVVRGADQHPLYPALIAASHPVVASAIGDGPDSWRVAAQGVSALAMTSLVIPYHGFARRLVGRREARLATFLFVLLPLSGTLGHETLSEATALLCAVSALAVGSRALETGRIGAAVGAGAIAGVGFLARPEVALVPVTIAAVWMGRGISRRAAEAQRRGEMREGRAFLSSVLLRVPASLREIPSRLPLVLAVIAPLVACVGSYAAIKGTVSEKLSMRFATGLGETTGMARTAPPWLPRGLDDPRWDFAPKEESDAPGSLGLASASGLVAKGIGEALAWVLVPLTAWGAWHGRRSGPAGTLVVLFSIAFAAVLVRHAMRAGYLSDRHCTMLAVSWTPWAASGAVRLGRGLAGRLAPHPVRRRRLAIAALGLVAASGVALQLKPGHPSRWGHRQAGRWLADQAVEGDAVLDTRGWAAFVSGLRSYGPWHIRQAISDDRLAFVVVGEDELTAGTRRAETLGALLDYAAEPVAAFPSRLGGDGVGVRVYRFERPESWEGIAR